MVENLYCSFINMDHRTDRLVHMIAQLAKIDLKAVRTRGLFWQEVDVPREKIAVMQARTPGAIGCHFAQVSVMKEAQRQGKNAMVLEDDVVFCSDFNERLAYIDKWTETNDWDVIWLGGTFHVPAFWHPIGKSGMAPDCSAQLGKDCETTDDPRMIRTYGAFSTYAYIVNVKSMDKIFALFDRHIHKSIGIDFLFILLQPQLRAFAYVPGCCKQMDNLSDIGTGMTIFSGFSKLNGTLENSRYWWQDKSSDFDPSTFNFNA